MNPVHGASDGYRRPLWRLVYGLAGLDHGPTVCSRTEEVIHGGTSDGDREHDERRTRLRVELVLGHGVGDRHDDERGHRHDRLRRRAPQADRLGRQRRHRGSRPRTGEPHGGTRRAARLRGEERRRRNRGDRRAGERGHEGHRRRRPEAVRAGVHPRRQASDRDAARTDGRRSRRRHRDRLHHRRGGDPRAGRCPARADRALTRRTARLRRQSAQQVAVDLRRRCDGDRGDDRVAGGVAVQPARLPRR